MDTASWSHLEEDFPITTFSENKRFSSSFCKQTNVIQVFNYATATVENLSSALTYLTSQEAALKFMNVIGPFAKKLENLFFSENVVIGQYCLSSVLI